MEPLLTPREVDQLLRFPHGRSVKLAKSGQLTAIFLPDGEIRFDRQEIKRWLREREGTESEVRR